MASFKSTPIDPSCAPSTPAQALTDPVAPGKTTEVLLRACLEAGLESQDEHAVKAAWLASNKDAGLARGLKEVWCEWLQDHPQPGAVGWFIDSVLGGKVERLWEEGLGGYASYLDMFRSLSPMQLYPTSLKLAQDQLPSGLPDAVMMEVLETLLYQSKGVLREVHRVLETAERSVLDDWLSINRPHGVVHLVFAVDRPNHPIWDDADFQMMCATNQYPPALHRLVAHLPEDALTRFTTMMARSSQAPAWEQAVQARRASEQAVGLENTTPVPRPRLGSSRL